jgi:hypothetical protein
MDEKCRNCQHICKQLDTADTPVCYQFDNLSARQLMLLVDKMLTAQRGWNHLELKDVDHASGDQLAACLAIRYLDLQISEDCLVHVVAQAQSGAQEATRLWFRFAVPSYCCKKSEVVGELSDIVEDIVAFLRANDSCLSAK